VHTAGSSPFFQRRKLARLALTNNNTQKNYVCTIFDGAQPGGAIAHMPPPPPLTRRLHCRRLDQFHLSQHPALISGAGSR